MSAQRPSASARPSSSIAPPQERALSPSNSIGDAPTTNPSQGKKTVGKKKTQRKQVAKETGPVEPVGASASQPDRYRYEPYRKADPTPEPEGNLPASPEELETLDATAKMIYKSDREMLEYIEALKNRTAAMLEYVNRTSSQLRSSKGAMERIQLFVDQWQKTDDQQFEDGNSEEDDAPNPDLLPTLPRSENGGFTVVEEHLSKNGGHPNFSHDYARDILGGSLSQPFDNDGEEEDFSRPETPPARQSSLPPGHEDENGLEYPEHEIEIRSDFTVPPDYAALRSDDSTFDRSGVDLRITSDTGLLFPPSEEELARISREFKREVVHSTAALAMQPPADPPRFRHPLAQSYVPSSSPGLFTRPEPQHLVPPRPVLRTPSPHRTVVGGKRKRVSTPEDGDEGNSVGNAARRPIVITNPEDNAFRQVMTRDDEGRVSPKRRRLQPSRGFHMLVEGDCVPTQPRAGAPTCDNSPEASSHASDKQASHPSIAASQIQKEDSELEKSQVFEMLSKGIEQGDSGDEEESTTNILGGLNESRRSLPALTLDNTQGTSVDGTRSRVATPIKSLLPTEVPTTIPDDVFGPVILSGKANKISDRLPPVASKKSNHGDFVTSDSENEIANVSSKSARFSLDGRAEKEHKVFRKTPFKPRPSSRVMEAEAALAAEVDDDVLKPLASPKKKRAIGARGRKPKPAPSIEAEPSPENGPPSISANNSPSKRRRGRSVQPGVPALPKTPVRRSTRNRK